MKKTQTHFPGFILTIFLILFQLKSFATNNPKIDPIRFTLTTDAQHILPNEEFEIKITAKYLTINPNLVYVFAGSNNFRLKLVVPDGFKQTGGTYHDYIGTELTTAKPTITYTVRGKFSETDKGGDFQLLRSHKDANSESEFIQVGKLSFTVISPIASKDSVGSQARLAVLTPKYVPYMTQAELRAGYADSVNVVYINEGLRSGIFQYKVGDTTTPDDSSMVLVCGTRRYFRENLGVIRPEWFGAIPSDGVDDYVPTQKALNYIASVKGGHLQFSVGKYDIGNTLVAKRVISEDPPYAKLNYRLLITGKGKGTTTLEDRISLVGKTMIDVSFKTGIDDATANNSYFEVSDMTINGHFADRVIRMNAVIDVKLSNLIVAGGIISNTEIGDETTTNYAAIVEGCYFNAGTYKSGHSLYLLNIKSIYAIIDKCTFDGGGYGIHSSAASIVVTNCNIEGSKIAAIYGKSTGGGNCIIKGNSLRPYGGFETAGQFTGSMTGIHLEATATGGASYNNIVSNNISVPGPTGNPTVVTLSNITGMFVGQSSETENQVTGSVSGATARVLGFNASTSSVVLGLINNGPFIPNETLTQTITISGVTTTATGKMVSKVTNYSYGIKLVGSNGNVVTGNTIRGGQNWSVHNTGIGTLISSNLIETALGGVYNSGSCKLIANSITTGTCIEDVSGGVTWTDNIYTGTLIGVSPQLDAKVTTSERNALVTKYSGLRLFDTTVNKYTIWNGSSWSYTDNTDTKWVAGGAAAPDLNLATNSGLKTWDLSSANTPGGYGTSLTFNGASSSGDAEGTSWTNQILARTDAELFWRQRIYTYGTWTANYKIWTSKHFSTIAASSNTATAAALSTPTKAEFDALLNELRDLKTKMRNANLLAP
jgi:hypothetical protein